MSKNRWSNSRIYKAQWPLQTNEQPMILIYPINAQHDMSKWLYLPAIDRYKKQLFKNRYIKVFFRGRIEGDTIIVAEFVKREEWM